MCKIPSKRSSEILMEIAENKSLKFNLTYQYILGALGERAFGLAILFFSLPAALPFSSLPGISVVFSLPIVIFALEIIFGRKFLWLPKGVANKTIPHAKVSRIIMTVLPYIVKLEGLSKPRWAFMVCRSMEIMNGIIILCLAFLLMLPIPFSNFIFATLLIVFSLGIAEKDGVLIFIGYLCFIACIFFIYVLTISAIEAFLFVKI